jgi:MFS family permease
MSDENQNKVINQTVVKLGLVSFFCDVANEMLYPITPIFLTSVLGASMASLGLIEGVAEAIASLLKTYAGSWSDSIAKRKPFILIGYLLSAIAKPFIGISQSWLQVLGARAFDRTGKGIRSAPRDALIADSVSQEHLGAAFGLHRGMDTLGAAVGPLLTIFLMNQRPNDLRSLYFWALIPGLLSVAVIFSVKEKKHSLGKTQWKNPFLSWNELNLNFKKYLLAWTVFSLANSSDVFLLMKAKTAGVSTQLVILLYCAYNLTYALSSPYLGKLSDRVDRKHLMSAGLIVFSLVYLGFSLASESWHFWILFLIYGFYMGATDGVGKALAIDLSPKNLKATGLGMLGTVTGIATIFASATAGLIWDKVGSTWTFIYGAAGAILAIGFLTRVSHPKNIR